MNTEKIQSYRLAATNSLAVVGFIALLGLGVWGAVYSARYVPGTVGAAAVYLGSLFNPAPGANVAVVPTATSTIISFGDPVASTTPAVATTTPAKPSAPTTTTVPVLVPAPTVAPYGLADLTVYAGVVGYLTTNATDSFIASTTVPSGARPAVKFTVKNIGTNWSGTWRFSASIPTRSSYTYHSTTQASVGPGDSIDYILGFDQSVKGDQQPLVITVNDDSIVRESNSTNNSIEFKINVR
ncbi:MAG: hypothetical protein WC030_02525 [Candidatus Paceibacterota bacterium]